MYSEPGDIVRFPNDKDLGTNPAATETEKKHNGQTSAEKVPQLCGRI